MESDKIKNKKFWHLQLWHSLPLIVVWSGIVILYHVLSGLDYLWCDIEPDLLIVSESFLECCNWIGGRMRWYSWITMWKNCSSKRMQCFIFCCIQYWTPEVRTQGICFQAWKQFKWHLSLLLLRWVSANWIHTRFPFMLLFQLVLI